MCGEPMNDEPTGAIATELLDALDRTAFMPPLAGRVPGFDLAAAHEVSAEMIRRRRARGERTIGRKLGFTNPATWAALGVDAPFWVHVYDSTVAFFETSQCSVSIGRLVQPRLEPEIVVHFRTAPPATADEKPAATKGTIKVGS